MQRLTILLVLLMMASCSAPRLDVGVTAGQLSIDGRFGVQAGPVAATSKFSDLGLDKDSSVPGARVDMDFGSPHLAISYLSSDFSGDGTTTSEFSQQGVVIPSGTNVRTSADLDVYSFVYTFDLVPTDTVELGIGMGATIVDVRGAIDQIGGPNSIDVDQILPLPLLAARGSVDLGDFELEGALSGMDFTIDGDSARVVDLDLAAQYRFLGGSDRLSLAARLGWRYINIDADYEDRDDNVRLDMGVDGPYLGLVIGF
jgi:hypothetical protein